MALLFNNPVVSKFSKKITSEWLKFKYIFGPIKDSDIQVLKEESQKAKKLADEYGLLQVGGLQCYANPGLQVDPGVMGCDAMAWLSGYEEVMVLSVTKPHIIREYARIIHEWNMKQIEIYLDITYGGWGQDGHVAYNQARRYPFSHVTIDDVRNSTIRIQENNIDTILTLAHRSFGSAYQFVPPMSVTLGVKECLSAVRIRLFSDTGAWKQTALRVALFGPLTPEYPLTLLQEHPDALLTATVETAKHPVSEHPEWDLGV